MNKVMNIVSVLDAYLQGWEFIGPDGLSRVRSQDVVENAGVYYEPCELITQFMEDYHVQNGTSWQDVTVMPVKDQLFHGCLTKVYVQGTERSVILLNMTVITEPAQMLEILSHELCHLRQSLAGRLIIESTGRTVWEGKECKLPRPDELVDQESIQAYVNLPWEVEARMAAHQALTKFLPDIGDVTFQEYEEVFLESTYEQFLM